jgi:transposase InsO family protein
MEEVKEVKKKKGKESRYGKRYGLEVKLRCVKLRLEEGVPISLLSKEVGASKDVIRRWTKAYQEQGETGLRNRVSPAERYKKLPGAVREKIVEIKKQEPLFGVKRISHLLKRAFFLSASPETIRRTLRSESLIRPTKKKHPHNITRPRFFERSTPNQMWQGDIFTFRLGGRNAYLIGFIDDYARYMVGLELYRSQTADQVLEVYRRAVGEYGVAKEVLTDRGRQYTNWRGRTRFERELAKDRVRHIRSQAHHPMTLGKIERFWKTIYEEFLIRAQFGSFEEAQDRIRQWVQYYNHKRPHQGIGGLCPADRYFEIATELRKTMEQGIADNVLEMALRGKPKEPFYMVGRMEGQSVVLRAEKGKLRLMVEDEESGNKQEMVYAVTGETTEGGRSDGKDGEAEDRGAEGGEANGAYGRGQVPGGALGVDGEAESRGGVPGDGGGVDSIEPVAGAGDGGDAAGVGAPGFDDREESGIELASCGIVGAEEQGGWDEEDGAAFEPASGGSGQTAGGVAGGSIREEGLTTFGERSDETTQKVQASCGGAESRTSTTAGTGDPPGTRRSPDGQGRGEAVGGLPQDVLRVGGAVPQGHGPGVGERISWKTPTACRWGEGSPSGKGFGVGEEVVFGGEDDRG